MNSAPVQPTPHNLLLRDLIEISIAHGLTIEQFKGATVALGLLPPDAGVDGRLSGDVVTAARSLLFNQPTD